MQLDLFSWFEDLIYSFSQIGDWLTTPLGGIEWLTPLSLTLSSGLLVFIGIAVAQWFIK